jgi:hypothetical protein
MQASFTAVLAPRQNELLYIDSYEILFGYRSASPTEYSPFHTTSTNGLSF